MLKCSKVIKFNWIVVFKWPNGSVPDNNFPFCMQQMSTQILFSLKWFFETINSQIGLFYEGLNEKNLFLLDLMLIAGNVHVIRLRSGNWSKFESR